MIPLRPSRSALWLAPAALILAACSETAPRPSQPISLSLTTRSASATATPAAPGASADIQIGSGANSLKITRAQIVLAQIELSSSATCTPPADDNDCDELEAGPVLVDLPVDGTTKVMLDALVQPGTYSRLQAELDAVTPDDDESGASAFLQLHQDFQGISVKVTGVFTDANSEDHPFTFTLEADAEIEAAFQPPVTVGAGTSNLTIDVDVASWFKDATGAVIDPTNPANAEAIGRNIRQSFKTFEDDNHDGMDDHQEPAGGH